MKDVRLAMNPNLIVQHLDKPASEFTRKDLIRFIRDKDVRMVNFRYVGGDSRLKTLNFVINSKKHLDHLLATGERVDGSSLFSYVDAGSSDLYVIPRYATAYVNPFSPVPTVDVLCSYYTREGVPLPSAPEEIVRRAHRALKKQTGLTMRAMGELEYYVLYEKEASYTTTAQRGYHGSSPFTKWEHLRREAMQAIAQTGGKIKYSHSEVGHTYDEENELAMEQHEIEFLPVPVEDAADQLVVAKWILRMLGHKYGVTVTFAPKILVGHAGSGLHIHSQVVENGNNVMIEEGRLSDTARQVIAGYLRLAPSLSAFGNTVPTSYLRLVPHQEAPTNICWGERNRSALVRVPLGWLNEKNMIKDTNPQDDDPPPQSTNMQTVEFRCPDGSANVHLLLGGMTVAARHGLVEMGNALEMAEKLYIGVNIFSAENEEIQKGLPKLPPSCWESAELLLKDREIYERYNVFTPAVIDGVARDLQRYEDKDLSERLYLRNEEIRKLVEEYFHCA